MQEIPFILTEWQEINSVLYAPLNATKKIQYTCMTASKNYIALGAISGSVYLFSREPCVFQQLIPLSEGAMHRAQISPDEKTIALATVKGTVCLVSLKPNFKLITVSTEHLKEKITCLCWNDGSTEVYVGDESGKVSVLVLSGFMINGVFPSPSYALMNLESKIVQMNFAYTLLLISTLNRCYICDTVQEQYKQIGNKPRDGEFGACFLQAHSTDRKVPAQEIKFERVTNVKKVFSMSGDFDNETNYEGSLPTIYCARPSSRFWEVTAAGVVVKTHQFKEALAIAPIPVYKPSIGKTLKLRSQNEPWPIQSINFSQLFVISNKYLFSYTSNGLYIFDPKNAEVVLWNDEFPDIFMAQIVDDRIYLMSSSGVFHCLTLVSVDSLILELYDKKLFKECFDVCQILRPQLVDSTKKESCDNDSTQDLDLPETLVPIISFIQSSHNTQPVKLESGIVVVNTGNKNTNGFTPLTDEELEEIQRSHELEDLMITLNVNGTSNAQRSNGKKQIGNGFSKSKSDVEVSSLQTTISNIQSDLASLSTSINSQLGPDLSEKQLEEILKLTESLASIKGKYEVSRELQSYLFEVIRSAELHYYNTLLESLPFDLIRNIENHDLLKQLVKIIVDVNSFKYVECCCGFPYPLFGTKIDKFIEPKFLDLGKLLLTKLHLNDCDEMCLGMCNQIPYLWRDYLTIKGYTKQQHHQQRIPDSLLKQCLQIRDNFVLATILPLLDEQQWQVAAHSFESIHNSRCANCHKPYNSDQVSSKEFFVDWLAVTRFIMKNDGPRQVVAFISKVKKYLSHASFDKSIYESIIYSTILNHYGVQHALELDHSSVEQNSVFSPDVLQEVLKSTKKDLDEPVNKEVFGSGPHHWGMRSSIGTTTCPCCTLSLQTPVLLGNNGITLFPCGHAYHVNCMIQKKISRCNLHA